MPDVEKHLVVVELAIGADDVESGPDEGPLRSDVVGSRVGGNPGHSVVGGHREQGDGRLCGVAVAAGRRSQAVADLDASAVWRAFEANPPDCPPIGQVGDPVVAEGPLLSTLGRRAKEAPDSAKVTLAGEILRPRIGGSRASSEDAFSLSDIDRVQLQA